MSSQHSKREFLNYYSFALGFGYERSFKSINKSVPGEFDAEQEFYFGGKLRFKRGMFDFRFGVLDPKLTVIDIEDGNHKNIDLNISRLFLSYYYFLN